MAAGAPARTPRQERIVIATADENHPAALLPLKVAFEAEVGISLQQHLLIHRTMHRMASGATLANGKMLENVRPPLRDVALRTEITLREQLGPPRPHCLALVWLVAVDATDLPLQHRVVIRQVELASFIQVALEARVWRFARIDNRMRIPAGLHMQAGRPMT